MSQHVETTHTSGKPEEGSPEILDDPKNHDHAAVIQLYKLCKEKIYINSFHKPVVSPMDWSDTLPSVWVSSTDITASRTSSFQGMHSFSAFYNQQDFA